MSTATRLPIGLQLYTLRELPGSEDERLALAAEVGYAYVETIHQTAQSGEAWKRQLAQHGLMAVSAHVPLEAFDADRDGTIQTYLDLGTRIVTIPIPRRAFWAGEASAADWSAFGAELNELGEHCQSAGLRLLYHNHWQEMQMYDGKRAIDLLLAESDAAHVGLEPDFAWIVKGGGDPLQLLRRYAGRCPCVHMKDLAPEGQNEDRLGLEDVGYGRLDWDAILPAADASGASWYIVEHDYPGEHAASITRSYNFIADMMRGRD